MMHRYDIPVHQEKMKIWNMKYMMEKQNDTKTGWNMMYSSRASGVNINDDEMWWKKNELTKIKIKNSELKLQDKTKSNLL